MPPKRRASPTMQGGPTPVKRRIAVDKTPTKSMPKPANGVVSASASKKVAASAASIRAARRKLASLEVHDRDASDDGLNVVKSPARPAAATTPTPTRHPPVPRKAAPPKPVPRAEDYVQAYPDEPEAQPAPSTSTNPSVQSSVLLPRTLPSTLHPFLQAQRRAILRALAHPPLHSPESQKAIGQLQELLVGTIERGEGNSCLVLGPKGSGKSRAVEEALSSLASTSYGPKQLPIVIRLSANAQLNDKLAMREIGRQLVRQTGSCGFIVPDDDEEAEVEAPVQAEDEEDEPVAPSFALPSQAHIPTLIATLSTLPRPAIIILESFDLFATHARQALLYCLLDAVQSCRAGTGTSGIAVLGVTTRVDCLNLLEKRVKSRFSHRIVRVPAPNALSDFTALAKTLLTTPIEQKGSAQSAKWTRMWGESIDKLFADRTCIKVIKETFEVVKDVGLLCRILTTPILDLTPTSPWLTPAQFASSAETQRCTSKFPFLRDLSYPCLALLIAAHHASSAGHETITFEMLHDAFSRAVSESAGINVSVDGAGVGMHRVKREVMLRSFEQLVASHVFQPTAAHSAVVAKQYVKYRCVPERDEIKNAIERAGYTMLKRWFTRWGQK